MPLMPLADAEDLAVLVRRPATDARVVLALKRASGRFREEVGYPVTQVTDDPLTVMGDGTDCLLLKGAPAKSVTVAIDGVAVTDFTTDAESGILYRTGGVWPCRSQIDVVYTHGYVEIPEGIVDAVLEEAVTLCLSYAHIQQETAGTNNASYSRDATTKSTTRWDAAIAKYALAGRA